MKIKEIIDLIENVAPPVYQESYDNAGLLIGDQGAEAEAVLLCLDTTEAVIDEAIRKGCKLILAHHPIIFKGLKRINGNSDIERAVIKAIKHDISIYAAHTNLDNVLHKGVNQKISEKLGLNYIKILAPKSGLLSKIQIYCPQNELEKIRTALFTAGAGHIGNYSECSFGFQGSGTFKPGNNANPSEGRVGERSSVDEWRIEALSPSYLANSIVNKVKTVHSYEEMAYEIIPLSNINQHVGSGMIGELSEALSSSEFLDHLKSSMKLELIKHTAHSGLIKKVAVCGGSGSFLLPNAIKAGADAYVTADLKYHEYFDSPSNLMFCDIGHYESEIYTLELFNEVIREKFPTFAVHFCEISTNPIQYHK